MAWVLVCVFGIATLVPAVGGTAALVLTRSTRGTGPHVETPQELLRRRYAAGELDGDEFLRRRAGLDARLACPSRPGRLRHAITGAAPSPTPMPATAAATGQATGRSRSGHTTHPAPPAWGAWRVQGCSFRGYQAYFAEGAGLRACVVRMGELEEQAETFAEDSVTVLPIVMNARCR